MARYRVEPTGVERRFGEDEIIVSKTDCRGRITYANSVFIRVAGFSEAELLGAPHSIIRHPDMPRCVFKLLWDTLAQGREIFAYVVNLAKNGDHYWVLAHVTPTFDVDGAICGYHSSRRSPSQEAVAKARDLYKQLRDVEASLEASHAGMLEAERVLVQQLQSLGMEYDEFVFSL